MAFTGYNRFTLDQIKDAMFTLNEAEDRAYSKLVFGDWWDCYRLKDGFFVCAGTVRSEEKARRFLNHEEVELLT